MGKCLIGTRPTNAKKEEETISFHIIDSIQISFTFLGTVNEMGSMILVLTLYARAISHSLTLRARFGINAMPVEKLTISLSL